MSNTLFRTLALSSLFVLASCTTATPSAPTPVTSKAIEAFIDICLKTAPSFAGSAEAAKRNGITELVDMGFTRIGFTADKNLSVQLSEKECVVATASQSDDSLTRQLLSAAQIYSQTPVADRVPSKVRIQDNNFILQHDRKGGETYVLLRNK
ncbi:hypothetical protein LOY49_10895 [Pseudomonas atacamensis]|jgi:hypothetical protein|uniref:hypothetical protein n=1 Tax=Pseudomonas atacamensis TaxID=2565368 RepID=UPI000F02ACE2|nr:hypothetical protein [Pseudomonas atacamensis]MDH2078121.1 hypothetical protein [Pseudomonas atacamensis]UVK95808.1 hypothetical protein LOY49_10895 [Pseudomonas atacamensis]UVL16454.1 hypothetical protein LOY27_11560 [Pseudomonas atacamensis]WGT31493.1 hypothetical protein QG303_13865 [Pseudomonas atacamensis]